ncbi:MAG: hypothetical protein WA816_13345 [Bacteroidales bacterium]
MSLLVKEITIKDGLDDFLSIPKEIYRNDPNWISPQRSEIVRVLDPLKNPYFLYASLKIYVCYSDGKPVCRSIMVINHLHWTKWNKKSAFFGFFDSPDDCLAVKCLFEKIEADSRAAGAEYLEGPFNPNHYSELGILLDNYNSPPVFFETYNPSYYPGLIKGAGFSESNLFHTRINSNISATLDKKYKVPEKDTISSDITIRKFNILRFKRDLDILRDINNDAFEDNKFFLPLSLKEYMFSAKYLFIGTRPGLILIAEYKGKPVGATQLVLNINSLLKYHDGRIRSWHIPGLLWRRRNIKELVIFTAGIKKAFRNKRVFALILRSAVKIFRNYSTLSTTWISDENLGKSLAGLLEMSPGKHFAIYSKQL